jgi:hypothetical protein
MDAPRLHHIGYVVSSIAEGLQRWESALFARSVSAKYADDIQKATVLFLELPDGVKLELVEPLTGGVEMWRGGLGSAYLLPALSSAGASLSGPCSVSTSRSSNRTCGMTASGSWRKCHDVAHGKLLVRLVRQTRPSL